MKKQIVFYFLILVLISASCAGKGKRTKYKRHDHNSLNYALTVMTATPWTNTLEDVIEIIDRGADIEYIDSSETVKTTPFLNASGVLKNLRFRNKRPESELDSMEMEAVKIVKYLAEKGANIHALSSNNSQNALHLAACGGREKMIPVLVDLGLDINSKDSIGGTALLHAIAAGDLATVKAIVAAGADINLAALDGNSPLDYAMAYTRSEEHKGWMPYRDQDAIAEYMQSIGAKHGKNSFKGYLYFDESK